MNTFSIGDERNRVGLFCSTWEKVLPHTYSTIVFLELYRNKDYVITASDASKFKKLIVIFTNIKRALARHKIGIEAQAQLIYSRFISPLSLDELKEIIGETLFCKFPSRKDEGMIFSRVSSTPPRLDKAYINLPTLLEVEEPTEPQVREQDSDNTHEQATVQPQNTTHQIAPSTLVTSSDVLIDVKREFEMLYDSLIDARGGKTYQIPTYIWQWAINIDEYTRLHTAIQRCNELESNDDRRALLNYDKCIFIIVAYIAERYKREWNGNTHTDNALIQIGFENLTEEVALKYFKDRSDMMIFQHDNRTQAHEYLESLRMEGGLPVKRIDGDNSLADFAEYLYDDKDKAIDILCERGKNKCMRYSYQEKLSIYHYTEQLLQENGIHTIYGSDVANVEDIQKFYDILANGHAKAERKKARLIFQAWHDIENNSPVTLTPILHMYPEDNGDRHYAISPSRLKAWGVKDTDSVNSFTLDFVDTDNHHITIYDENYCEIDSILFSRCYNGDFVEFNSRKRFFFPSIPEEKLNIENIYLGNYHCRLTTDISSDVESPKILPTRKEMKEYIQLYSNDNKFWVSNKGADPYKYSALIVEVSKNCHPTNENYESLSNGLVWIPFTTHVELSIKGHKRIIYNSQGKIYALPQAECIHPICKSPYAKNLRDGLVEFYGDSQEDTQSIFLVKSSNIGFDIYREDRQNKRDTKVQSTPVICYRRKSDSDWEAYDSSIELSTGYIEFNVTIDNRYSTVVKCFILPSDCSLEIDLQQKKVCFRDIKCNVKHNGRTLSKINETTFTYTLSQKKKSDGDGLEDTNGLLTFSIHCDRGHFNLMTLYPIQGKFYILQNGRLLSSKRNNIRTVPLAFIGRFKKVTLDSSGGKIEHVGNASPEAYKYVLNQNAHCVLPNSENGKEVDGCRFVAYSGSFEKAENRRIFKVPGNTELQPGCFYFLSLETNEIMELLHDEDRYLNLESIEHEGILFQSLKGRSPMDVYLRPMYVAKKTSRPSKPRTEERMSMKKKRIEEFIRKETYLTDFAYHTFNIASEHGLYFSSFDVLLSLIAEYKPEEIPARICRFLAGYEKYCNQTNSSPNYTGLWRLSTELIFDWLFISKRHYDEFGVSDEIRNGLYDTRPTHRIDDIEEYNQFIEWINSGNNETLRANSVKKSLLNKNWSIFSKPEKGKHIDFRCSFLEKAYNQSFKDINQKRKLE